MLSIVASLACALVAARAHAAGPTSTRKLDYPCAGCITEIPDALSAWKAGDPPAPLLVVLHGDASLPSTDIAPWVASARARGVVLFAPKCPTDLGCKGSWWRWSGDASWFDGQIATIDATTKIEPSRTWIAGWSGGASYLGWVVQQLEGRFAAVSINGGGMVAAGAPCPTRCKLPAHFLVGDANPLHGLAKELRAWFASCGQENEWDLLPGANHAAEFAALSKPSQTDEIFDWLMARPLQCATTLAIAEVPADASASSSALDDAGEGDAARVASTDALPSAVASTTPASPAPPATRGRCGCTTIGASEDRSISWIAIAVLAMTTLRRARRV